MQAQSSNGLQFLFEKSKGVDTYYLYNAGNTPITLQEVRIETNVFIGRGIYQQNFKKSYNNKIYYQLVIMLSIEGFNSDDNMMTLSITKIVTQTL